MFLAEGREDSSLCVVERICLGQKKLRYRCPQTRFAHYLPHAPQAYMYSIGHGDVTPGVQYLLSIHVVETGNNSPEFIVRLCDKVYFAVCCSSTHH